jgi:hypothetical protein
MNTAKSVSSLEWALLENSKLRHQLREAEERLKKAQVIVPEMCLNAR